MAGLCSVGNPQGLNQKCLTTIAKAAQIAIVEKGTAFSVSSLNVKNQFVTSINTDLAMYVFKLTGYDNTSDDPEVQTTQFGQKSITNQPPPSITAYGELNPCDYVNLLQTLNGGSYDVVFLNDDGTVMGWVNGDVFKGFGAKIWAVTKGVPAADNLAQFYRIDIFFSDINEFKAFRVLAVDYNPLIELIAEMPNGLGLSGTSYNGTVADVFVGERCGDGVEGFVLADFEIVDTNSSAAITAVTDNGGGSYSVSLTLASGEWAKIRVNKITATITTDISGNIILSV